LIIEKDLLLGRCTRITDAGLDHVSQGLKGLDFLERINLNFSQCKKITSKEQRNFLDELKNLGGFSEKDINVKF